MQPQHQDYRELSNSLKSAVTLLNLPQESQLYRDVTSICEHLANPNFRIAVFGPFNHGKSTLLNAILGNRALPIDLIPTTGAAIVIKYGSDVRTRITLVDGTEIYRSGTDILKQFAILDSNRRMRSDVASVEVFCPHPFLQTGIEFLDLPGTNDREEQENLVREKLLSADLVVQLLDARKLMTLGERENLRDWLLDRGIKTVIFVANFVNLLEPDEQKQVQNRLRFVAESFRTDLPANFSNLYRVDALPALRARLKGDVTAASSSGLVAFETALQNIVEILQQNQRGVRSPRVQSIASQIQASLKTRIIPLADDIKNFTTKETAKIEIKRRAEQLIKQGFSSSISELRDWFNLSKLLNKYQADAAVALTENKFQDWERDTLRKDLNKLQLAVVKWLDQAYDFFLAERPEDLLITFPSTPQIILPPKPNNNEDLSDSGAMAIGGGLGWLLGGPLGAAVVGSISYLVNQKVQTEDETLTKQSYHQQVAKICVDAVEDYLNNFSREGLSILAEYERKAESIIQFQIPKEPDEITKKREQLQRLQYGLNNFQQQLEKTLGISIPLEPEIEVPKPRNTQSVYRFSGTGVREDVGTRGRSDAENFYKSPSPPPPSSMKPEEVDATFRAWELDEEIARMKAEMGNPGSQTNNKAGDKDKINRAYAALGLQPGASIVEVKQAYRNFVKKSHPDLFVNQPQLQRQAEEKLRIVNEAYTLLSEQNS